MKWLVGLALLSFAPSALACSCLQPDLKQQWATASDMIGVRILGERVVGMERQFRARVFRVFGGCLQPGDEIVLTTPRDGATCGASYQVGQRYVLAAHDAGRLVAGLPARDTNSCGWAQPVSAISQDDRDYLMSRPITCNGALSCADGQPPVSCFVDPCDVASCPTGDCLANTCAGQCLAEFYDPNGYPVCEPW